MNIHEVKEFDVVITNRSFIDNEDNSKVEEGEVGTIVHLFDDPFYVCVEFNDGRVRVIHIEYLDRKQ